MERLIREHETKVLVIVASPRALADQRSTFHTEVKTCIIAEINKDHPPSRRRDREASKGDAPPRFRAAPPAPTLRPGRATLTTLKTLKIDR
jgi:hypothetical protein